jgi:hypothetical protein
MRADQHFGQTRVPALLAAALLFLYPYLFECNWAWLPILDEPACISSLKIKINHEIILAITL